MFKKGIVLFVFAFFQVLFAFTSLTSLQYIVSSLFVILATGYLLKKKILFSLDWRLALVIILFLISYLFSTLFSHSIPVSVESFLQFFSSLSIFMIFFSFKNSNFLSKYDFVLTLILIGFALSIIYIFFLILPETNQYLPPINIFTSIYGHSHFAAYLILFIPLTWWFILFEKFFEIKNKWLLLLFQYVLLIFTFARGAQLIVFAQTLIIYWLFLRNNKHVKLEKIVVSLFLIVSTLIIIVSSLTGLDSCFIESRKDQLCKYYEGENIRLTYFKQSFDAIKDYPIFGYGPGTYFLIKDKYHQVGSFSSIYAHNFYLHLAAESGIITAALMVILILYILKYGFIAVKASASKKNYLNLFLYLGFVSSCINSLFDFDWHLFQVIQLSLIFGALLLWDLKIKKHTSINVLLMKFVLFFFTVVFFINSMVHYLIIRRQYDTAFDVFPYLYMYGNYYDLGSNLSPVRKQEFFKLHENHPDVLLRSIESSEDIQEIKRLHHQLENIMPWHATNSVYQEFLYSNSYFTELGEVALRAISYLEKYEKLRGNGLRKTKAKAIQYLFESAQYELSVGNTQEATRYFNGVVDEFHHDLHQEDIHYIYQDLIRDDFDWSKSYYDFLIDLYELDPGLAEKIIRNIYHVSVDRGGSEFFVNELAKISYRIANDNFENMNYQNAAEFYTIAAYFEPWILNSSTPLFIDRDEYKSLNDRRVFWNEMFSFPDTSYINYSSYVAGQYMLLLQESVLNSDIKLVEQYMDKVLSIDSSIVSEYESSVLPQLQQKANTLLMNENYEEAKRYIAVISKF